MCITRMRVALAVVFVGSRSAPARAAGAVASGVLGEDARERGRVVREPPVNRLVHIADENATRARQGQSARVR
ncbi:MAG: hypothetical protein AVDCRST_MAG40-2705 [uncultured Gemmatimonadaceae bacterium]|uniref:Secreted protein n=1 Tax=uncultured Gemmatimonadaceae bacterium TaxID=246130 RepID=A0A6J4M1R6_9BACT|nr:MAG: hypothetical protein AVDCRST_MAG40-2705 [uncultured Gemmatimonadaceae bacterium]